MQKLQYVTRFLPPQWQKVDRRNVLERFGQRPQKGLQNVAFSTTSGRPRPAPGFSILAGGVTENARTPADPVRPTPRAHVRTGRTYAVQGTGFALPPHSNLSSQAGRASRAGQPEAPRTIKNRCFPYVLQHFGGERAEAKTSSEAERAGDLEPFLKIMFPPERKCFCLKRSDRKVSVSSSARLIIERKLKQKHGKAKSTKTFLKKSCRIRFL